MRVAIVHYWLVGMRGGEKVVEAVCEIFPQADVFTHVYQPESVSETIRRHRVETSFIQRLPRAAKWYKNYLPLMPLALEQLDLRGYDLVISSESGPAKGVLVSPEAVHVCYCHTPMRYLWDMYQDYLAGQGWLKKAAMIPFTHYLRLWDLASASRVDWFVANSSFVAKRIKKFYRRDAAVIPPPVDTQCFSQERSVDRYYLMFGELVEYKRPDLAVAAFRGSDRELIVIGDGPERSRLEKTAPGNVRFVGRLPLSEVQRHLSRSRALIFPGVEDFGIVPVEAMAAGCPVIAFGRGGVKDSVIDGVTGVLFTEQTADGLQKAIERFEQEEETFDETKIRGHAEHFDKSRFKARFRDFVMERLGASGIQ